MALISGNNLRAGEIGNAQFAGLGGKDAIDGDAGINRLGIAGHIADHSPMFDGAGRLSVSGDGGAAKIGSNVEQAALSDHAVLLVGEGGDYTTIQQAIDAASAGDTILVAAGEYTGNISVNKADLSIIAEAGATLTGTFQSENGFEDHVDVALRTATAYSGNAGAGLTISASGVTIEGLKIDSFLTGVEIGDNVAGLTLQDVIIEDTVNGLRKSTAADITDLKVIGGLISHTVFGINFAKAADLTQGFVDGVLIDGTHFEHLMEKGIYVEALSNALFTNLVMNDVGEFGRGPAFGGTGVNTSGFGAGIDINLKAGAYENIVIDGFTFTDVGSSDGDGSAHPWGGAITVKARDDAPSYSGTPATFDGAIIITNGTITGTSTAIRAGEPGKNVSDPSVDISHVTVSGEIYDYDNVSQSVFQATGSNDADAILTNSAATGAFLIAGGNGDDTISTGDGGDSLSGQGGADNLYGQGGDDSLNGGQNNDILDGGSGHDTLDGGKGDDLYVLNDLSDTIIETRRGGSDTATSAAISLDLGSFENVENAVLTGTGDLFLIGDGGDNILSGNSGANRITGGGGKDIMTGGAGGDVFALLASSDSAPGGKADHITDFVHGVDLIDLSSIDANPGTLDDNAFGFIGSAKFTHAGQLRAFVNSHGDTVIQGNLDGDKAAEFQIVLDGDVHVQASDFIL